MANQEQSAGGQGEGLPPADTFESHVAVDFGSTGTRVTILARQLSHGSSERLYEIEDTRADADADKRFDHGEFPSVCCPFDGPAFLVGYEAASQTAKRTVSLKSLVYFLTNNNDDHPFTEALKVHHESLPSPEDKKTFQGDLKNMLSEFFTAIVDKILLKAQKANFNIRCITLCVPNTWSTRDSNIQFFLGDLLDKIVSGKEIEITFTFEAAARAQYLLWKQPEELKHHSHLMVLDFGGHSMGGSFGRLRWKKDGHPAIYSPPDSDFGIRGGYEIWEIEIGKAIDEQMTRDWRAKARFPEKHRAIIRAAFLDDFFKKKAHLPLTKPKYRLHIDLQDTLDESKDNVFEIELSGQVLKDAWNTGYREVLNLAKKHIKAAASNVDVNGLFVLVSGGSIINPEARDEILDYCNKWGRLRSHCANKNKITVRLMKDIRSSRWKWTIPEGAAICLANTMNVEEVFDKGAALAIQSSTRKGNFTPHTSNSAKLLFCKQQAGAEKHPAVEILLRQDKVIRLIADPEYFNAGGEASDLTTVLARNSYDIWDVSFECEPTPGSRPPALSRLPDGHYIIDVSDMKYDGWDAVLTLRLRQNNSPAKRAARQANSNANELGEDAVLYFEVPFVSHGESNLVVLDQERIAGRYWKLAADAGPGTANKPRVDAKPANPAKQAISGAQSKRRRRSHQVMNDKDSEWEEQSDGEDGGHGTYDGRPAKRVSTADM